MVSHRHPRARARQEHLEQNANDTGPSDPATSNATSQGNDPRQWNRLFAGAIVSVAVVAALIWFAATPIEQPSELAESDYGPVPDFAAIDDIPARKAAFFGFLKPMIDDQNNWILDNRTFLQSLRGSLRTDLMADGSVGTSDRQRVEALAKRYGVTLGDGVTVQVIDELLHRGDVIPTSLVLAQAAKESGWGMSRFAREGNNYFGEWCYTEGCGIVPGRRGPGEHHEVETFASVEAGVDSYFRNLNRGGPYRQVRAIRAQSRELGRPISSTRLAGGLQKYSERGQVYVDEVRALISYNKLVEFDTGLAALSPNAR